MEEQCRAQVGYDPPLTMSVESDQTHDCAFTYEAKDKLLS